MFLTNPYRVKVCPWCKMKPSVIATSVSGGEHLGYYSIAVKCTNPRCLMHPSTEGFITSREEEIDYYSRQAINTWNCRKRSAYSLFGENS